MSQQDALQDRNRFPSLIVQQGSTGTANTGTETMRLNGDSSSGALYVYNLGPAGSVSLGDITGGTIDQISQISGTVAVNVVGGGVGGGAVYAGTPHNAGTFVAVRLTDGTNYYTAGASGGGTTVTVDHGTITVSNPTGTTIQFNNGTVDLLKSGTITRVEGGTIGLVTRVANVGTLEVGTISSIPNIPGGTLNLVTTVTNLSNGTIQSSGTTTGVGTVTNLGSVTNIGVIHNAGTIASIPNIPGGTIGVVSNLTNGSVRVTLGTVGGAAASGAAASGNPLYVAGTNATGTLYGLRTDDNGVLQINGTVSTGGAGTQATRIIDGTVTNVGTVANIGSITNIGMLHGGTVVTTMGDLSGGTIDLITRSSTLGTLEVGTVTVTNPTGTTVQFNNGTVNLLNAGTITRLEGGTLGLVTRVSNVGTLEVGTISTLPNIPGGTLALVTTVTNLSNGTIQSSGTTTGVGTVTNIGVIHNAGTLATGSLANVATLHNGTVRNDARTVQSILTYGTQFGAASSGYATIQAAPGVGTSIWVQDLSIINPNANITVMAGFGTTLQGTSVLFRGSLGTTTGVGIQKTFTNPTNAGVTNTALVVYISAAGTIDASFSYFVA